MRRLVVLCALSVACVDPTIEEVRRVEVVTLTESECHSVTTYGANGSGHGTACVDVPARRRIAVSTVGRVCILERGERPRIGDGLACGWTEREYLPLWDGDDPGEAYDSNPLPEKAP